MAAANPLQGEVAFETKDGRQFVAVFDIAAVCVLEDLIDKPSIQIFAQAMQGRVGYIRAGLWAGLRRKHADLSLDDVGELMGQLKDRKGADILKAGFEAAFPKPKAGAKRKGNPRKAPGKGGTGTAS